MTATVPLSRGLVALVDDADLPLVLSFGSWSAMPRNRTYYARRTVRREGGGSSQYMHRVLVDWPRVDHINGDGLDNRRCNLRPATHADNMRNARLRVDNSSGFKGVTASKRAGRWAAAIHVNGRRLHLGSFEDAQDAARAYDAAALTYFGEFARLNFPQEI